MKRELSRLFAASALFLIFLACEGLALSCSIATSCGAVTVFRVSSATNAHAQLPTQTNYAYYVCCNENSLSNSCSGNYAIVAKLSGATNAHVEENVYSNYTNNACLSMTNGSSVDCKYSSDCATFGSKYVCVASMSSDSNAHVGGCSDYGTKVCCAIVSYTLTFSLNATTVWWGDPLNASGRLTDWSGNPVGGTSVSIGLGSQTQCSNTTDSSGYYWCAFAAPSDIGTYVYNVSTNSAWNTTGLTVAVSYGKRPIGTASTGAFTIPMLMQLRNGTVLIKLVNFIVSRLR